MAGAAAHSGEGEYSVEANGDGFDSLTDDLSAGLERELEPGQWRESLVLDTINARTMQ